MTVSFLGMLETSIDPRLFDRPSWWRRILRRLGGIR